MNQPYEIPYSIPYTPQETREDLLRAFDSGIISGSGPAVSEVESLLAARLGMSKSLTVSNGSAAIRLALQVGKIRPGMKVVLPGWGFHVAANIAYSMGARLEFRDVGIDSWCLDLDDNQDLINTDEKSILVLIHTLGNFGKMESLTDFKSASNLFIVEDSAEALFSEFHGKPLGTIFDVGTYSFHAAKTITSGEGGLFVASESKDYERALLIRNHGMTPDRPYFHHIVGDNYRLSNILAALLLSQIKNIDEIIFKRERVYKSYLRELKSFPPESFIQPTDQDGFFPWGFGFRVPSDSTLSTAQIREKMKLRGVDTRPGFTSAVELPYFDKSMLVKGMNLDISESLAKQVILLPHYPDMTDEDIFKVCDSLIEILS